MKLSIIIPYYNTYELTKKLLDVLEPQIKTHQDIVEVILVDDGCNEKGLDTYSLIHITHLDKNYGASHAWNVGLNQAKGEYIGFIDSDDMITENYIDTLLYAIEKENTDEIQFGFKSKEKIRYKAYCRAIWKSIYKRWLIIPFDKNRKYDTDVPMYYHLKDTSHTKSFINILLYYYNADREGSITWNKYHNKGGKLWKNK